jgi:hypothetical protein
MVTAMCSRTAHSFPRHCFGLSKPQRRNVRALCQGSKSFFRGYSHMVDRFLLLFLVQQDLGVQLQRAINYEQSMVAKEIQKRKAEVNLFRISCPAVLAAPL